ncbi:YolD-like family protein (plasmid) [Alkalihalophilus sp. As8PL]|uniref:YolD-like family protein n=1 Tax=Alkalihalophilus sp. As8PL TaxID=3237103 RepID=A0AB39BNC4_9BACI
MQYRGMIKWTQMAIPEHLEMIRKERKEKRKPSKPQLDQHQLSEIGYVIEEKKCMQNLLLSIIGT